jgi:hypothetical protein
MGLGSGSHGLLLVVLHDDLHGGDRLERLQRIGGHGGVELVREKLAGHAQFVFHAVNIS